MKMNDILSERVSVRMKENLWHSSLEMKVNEDELNKKNKLRDDF